MLRVISGTFGYDKKTNLIENLSFSLEKGDILAILGANGIGKTTLLKCLIGLLEWKSGECHINDKNVQTTSIKERFKTISYVPQSKNPPLLTSFETVLLGRTAHLGLLAMPKKEDEEKAKGIFQDLGINQLMERSCNTLSGGEYQMVLIARALMNDPSILVFDEPETGLDFKNQQKVLNIIAKLAKQNITCLFNTHYPANAIKVANKILMFTSNEVLFGSTDEILTEENISKAFNIKVKIVIKEEDGVEYKSIVVLD